MDILPVIKTTTAQAVAGQLLEMIRSGTLKPGQQLPTEKELIEKLRVGRSTVREALQILSTLNVIQATAGHGTFVKEPAAAEVFRPDLIGFLISNSLALELLEAREMFEPQCVRLATIRGSAADFDRAERLLDDHAAAQKRGSPVSEFAAKFHVLLAEASHNQVAVSFMTSILGILKQRGRRFDRIPDFQLRELEQHRAILDVVRTGDADRAAEMMLAHIVESAATYDADGVLDGVSPLMSRRQG
jgi:GntR family transcriptional repressor for pyruvate dehydrogenase complex